MKTDNLKKALCCSFAILSVLSVSAVAQTPKADVSVFELGDQAVRIPAPEGFEEAASQFETLKKLMSTTESPLNDMLAVHLPHADCERLRAGGFGPFNFYTKVSVFKESRNETVSSEQFAKLVAFVRKNSPELFDINSSAMKTVVKRMDQGLSEASKKEIQVDVSQPVNLGQFDSRPEVYSFMLAMNLTTQTDKGSGNLLPLLAGVSLVRVKQRLIYVYTYRKYVSAVDAGALRDFTKQWVSQILAANSTGD
jgi:hypothetical protein